MHSDVVGEEEAAVIKILLLSRNQDEIQAVRHGGQKGGSGDKSFRRNLGNKYLKIILKDY